jgi:hypothetical protein
MAARIAPMVCPVRRAVASMPPAAPPLPRYPLERHGHRTRYRTCDGSRDAHIGHGRFVLPRHGWPEELKPRVAQQINTLTLGLQTSTRGRSQAASTSTNRTVGGSSREGAAAFPHTTQICDISSDRPPKCTKLLELLVQVELNGCFAPEAAFPARSHFDPKRVIRLGFSPQLPKLFSPAMR